jgi:hypothetical protein
VPSEFADELSVLATLAEGWDRRPRAYLLLSAQPMRRALPMRAHRLADQVHGGKHLDLVRRPADVATALLDLQRAMWAAA